MKQLLETFYIKKTKSYLICKEGFRKKHSKKTFKISPPIKG
jgi:hypothetical protein